MIYADQDFYAGKYLLGRKPVISAGFSFYARQASQIIDRYTFDRIDKTNVPEAVSMCCCELAEAEFKVEKQRNESGGKTSEKIGSTSFGYATAKEVDDASASERCGIIRKWLEDTGMLYQGVD